MSVTTMTQIPRPDAAYGRRALIGGASGLLAGLLYAVLLGSQAMSPMMSAPSAGPGDLITHLILSSGVGLAYAVLLGDRALTAGRGLVTGIVAGLIWWGIGPLTLFPLLHQARPDWSITAARDAFPLLVGLAVTFGAAMGWLNWLIRLLTVDRAARQTARQRVIDTLQGAISGGLAGLIGGWVFGIWMEQVGFFPLIAGLAESSDPGMGRTIHFGISILIGITYGVICQRDITTAGSSVAWGFAYGLIWWVLGPLTLMPLLLGQGIQWSLPAAQAAFPSLIGHLLYGILLGMVQAVLLQTWRTLFIDSDPLLRAAEGPGTRGLRGIGLGAAASIVGGLAFTGVMVATNALPTVASLIGMSSAVEGFLVHMGISILIGAAFGLLFRAESAAPVAAVGWGIFYGLAWWVLGPLTLLPALLGAPLTWSIAAAAGAFPSLIGHLIYGGLLAFGFERLLRRFAPRSAVETADVPTAPALWGLVGLVCILMLILLP